MAKNRNGPNRKYGKRIELRTEQNESNKTETAVYRFSPSMMTFRGNFCFCFFLQDVISRQFLNKYCRCFFFICWHFAKINAVTCYFLWHFAGITVVVSFVSFDWYVVSFPWPDQTIHVFLFIHSSIADFSSQVICATSAAGRVLFYWNIFHISTFTSYECTYHTSLSLVYHAHISVKCLQTFLWKFDCKMK